jgi:hypothetical protein
VTLSVLFSRDCQPRRRWRRSRSRGIVQSYIQESVPTHLPQTPDSHIIMFSFAQIMRAVLVRDGKGDTGALFTRPRSASGLPRSSSPGSSAHTCLPPPPAVPATDSVQDDRHRNRVEPEESRLGHVRAPEGRNGGRELQDAGPREGGRARDGRARRGRRDRLHRRVALGQKHCRARDGRRVVSGSNGRIHLSLSWTFLRRIRAFRPRPLSQRLVGRRATVIATASSEDKLDFVTSGLSTGATAAVHYKTQDFVLFSLCSLCKILASEAQNFRQQCRLFMQYMHHSKRCCLKDRCQQTY